MAEQVDDSNIPAEFLCPITQEIMEDPVIGSDGVTYERSAIVEALLRKAESPMTRAPMTVDKLAVNYALKGLIEKWRETNKGVIAPKKKPVAPVKAAPNATITVKTIVAPHPLEKGQEVVCVTVNPPAEGERRPAVVIALLDESGSMSLDAAPQTQEAEDVQGFSRLDLVKHSMKTITKVLKPQDYLSIITFSDRARVRLEPRKMDAGGQAAAATTVDSLNASGGTNIWDALRVGIEQTKLPICAGKDVVILLLTDGEPTTNPPKGIVETLRGTLQTIESQNFTISSFGFGYNLDSLLLDNIARLGNGSFGFIPDCSMVGTIFINFLANTLVTRLHNARLVVEDTEYTHLFAHTSAPNSLTVPIGSIRFGQKRSLVFARKAAEGAKPVRVSLESVSADGKGVDLVAETAEDERLTEADASMLESFIIGHAVDLLYEVAKDSYSVKSVNRIKHLKEIILNNIPEGKRTPLIKELLLDIDSSSAIEGQLLKSVSREDWFTKWGRNHLLSFCTAHRYEQCSNFKDKSLQLYGGAEFKKIQDEANSIFVSLPPPVSSIEKERANLARFSGGGGAAAGAAAPAASAPKKRVNMSSFMNSRGICFDGEGFVAMEDGSTKQVKNLKKGDQLKGGARIVAVVQTLIMDDKPVEVVNMNGVLVTPWHPVMHNGVWAFPAEVRPAEQRYLTTIYNLVLSENHVVEINGLQLITMAHERNSESPVLSHPYFGTKRVVQDLMKFPGWERGHIFLNGAIIERDASNLICSIRHSEEEENFSKIGKAAECGVMYA